MTVRQGLWAALLAVAAGLGGCASEPSAPSSGEPSMYVSMASAEATLDAGAAAAMISGYRANNGLGGVSVDPEAVLPVPPLRE